MNINLIFYKLFLLSKSHKILEYKRTLNISRIPLFSA